MVGVLGDLITGPEISQAFGKAHAPSFGSSNDDNERQADSWALREYGFDHNTSAPE